MSKKPVGKTSKTSKSYKITPKKSTKITKSSKSAKSSSSVHKKPQVSHETSKTRKNFLPISTFAKKVITIGIIICAAIVLMCLVVSTYYEPAKVAQRKLEDLAADYYENYYYDKFTSSLKGQSIESAIAELGDTGFAVVPLRHLLLFDNERNSDYSKYFDNSRYYCDRSLTTIKIYPDAPYGRTDYHVEYNNTSCKYR